MMWKKHSFLAVMLAVALFLPFGAHAFAGDPAIEYHLDDRRIPSKDGNAGDTIIFETAKPDPDAIDPNDPNGGDRTGNPSANPGGTGGNGGGASSNKTGQGGDTNAPTTQQPSGVHPSDANPQNRNPNGQASSEQASPGQANPSSANPSSANPGGTTSQDAHPGDANPNDANPGEAHPNGANKPEHHTPWYKSLWNKTKQAAKGALAGGIGAAIVIGGALVVAAVLGVTIGAPVLIAAAVVGVVAGAIYALTAGDNFSWTKGIGIGGLAALTVITIGEMGVGAAIRGGIQAIRSAGLRGALRMAGSRALPMLRGMLGGMKNGAMAFVRGMARAPLSTLKSLVMSKTFGTAFGLNVLGNYFAHMAGTGKIPGFGDTVKIVAESFVGALVFDRILRIKLGKFDISKLKRTQNFRPNSLKHIFHGEINVKGKAVGYHYEGISNTPGRVIPGTESPPNSYGVYQAKVEVNGIPKTGNNGYSTFFPKNMSPQKIVDSINHAYSNKVHLTGNTYVGTASNGMKIQMYLDPAGKIISAFPVY